MNVLTYQSWADCRELMAADSARHMALKAAAGMPPTRWAWLDPAQLCVKLYRLSSYFFRRERRLVARFLWHLNLILSGADISPAALIGPGFVVIHPVSITVIGHAGRNLTVVGHGGMGAGLERRDIGAGLGLPILGDDIVLPMKAGVLGAIRVGHRVRLFPGCIVTRDLPDDAELIEIRPVRLRNDVDSGLDTD